MGLPLIETLITRSDARGMEGQVLDLSGRADIGEQRRVSPSAGVTKGQMADRVARPVECSCERLILGRREAGGTDRDEACAAVPALRDARIDIGAEHVVAGKVLLNVL